MRNPDQGWPMEPDDQPLDKETEEPASRRGAVVALALILLLIVGGVALTRALRSMSQLQDCALSGRSNCT